MHLAKTVLLAAVVIVLSMYAADCSAMVTPMQVDVMLQDDALRWPWASAELLPNDGVNTLAFRKSVES